MSEYIPCFSFWVWVTSLRMIFSSSIHLPTNFLMSLFFKSWVMLYCVMYLIFFICSSVEGHLGCFQFGDIMNKAAMNIVGQLSSGFGYMPRSCIDGSWGRSIPNFLRNCCIDLWSGCTSLHWYLQWRNVPCFASSPAQGVICGFDLTHSYQCKMESSCHFDLHFPGGKGCWPFLFFFFLSFFLF